MFCAELSVSERRLIAFYEIPKSSRLSSIRLKSKRSLSIRLPDEATAKIPAPKIVSTICSRDSRSGRKSWLRRPDISKIVSSGLLKFDGDRYTMAAFVVMPNHVHLLAAFREEGMITTQGAAWRRFFAREINAIVGRSDHFWQEDQFDHLVRSEASFDRIRRYIIDNPAKAKQRFGEYRLYVSPEL